MRRKNKKPESRVLCILFTLGAKLPKFSRRSSEDSTFGGKKAAKAQLRKLCGLPDANCRFS
ncbi:MAG TPA: hypothetical protein DIT25_02365 [Candidatus Moranbacteria bacterium]|nr:hypothetical protein [Candidatus Moranbacteria bacterium]